MKAFYLTLSILLTVLLLIIAFGNIGASFGQFNFVGIPVRSNPTFIILGISVIGILTGMTYHAFVVRILGGGEEDTGDM